MTTSTRPLSGRRALITGGNRGIGAATAIELARLGANIVITYRSSAAEAEHVVQRCRDLDVDAVAVVAELGGRQPGKEIADAAAAVVPSLDIVVVNAAAPVPRRPLAEVGPEELVLKAQADVAGLHRLCLEFGPGMAERAFGRFIVISSGASWGATAPGLAAHGISKAAQEAYVRYAATELLTGPVTINALQLGFVDTQASAAVPESARRLLAAATPGGHLGSPDDIAGVVGLLAQPQSGWITGAAIPVTGGLNYPLNLGGLARAFH